MIFEGSNWYCVKVKIEGALLGNNVEQYVK